MSLPTVMLLDGESRTSTGVVRSLGRLGIPLMVGSSRPLGRSCFSRYAKHRFTYPPSENGLEATHAVIIDRVRAWKPDILMPIFDEGWSVVYAHYLDYQRLVRLVPSPRRELFHGVADKGQLAEYAEQHGIPIPRTFRPGSHEEALSLRSQLPYPVLLKPRRSVSGIGIKMVHHADQLSSALGQFQDVPLIQEKIEGQDLELTIFCVHGKPMAGSAYISLRNAPLPFGPPVACRTIENSELMRVGMEFLAKLQYHGVAHLDFRRDRRDGIPKLLDFNPRLAGTNEISTRSGVDFALMQYRMALGEEIESSFTYEIGLEFRWLGELRHLLQTPNRLRTFRDLLRWGRVHTEISLADPMPHLVFFIDGLRSLTRRLLR
jgi:predicted ATP-grasp superfamily ATP-dependent carboligase